MSAGTPRGALTAAVTTASRPRVTGVGRVLALGVVLALAAIGGTFLLDPYRNFQLATAAATFCAVAGLSMLVGQTGQLSLGHAALMASGGYGYALTANALTDAGVQGLARFVLSLAAGVMLAAVLGLLLGLAAARLQGPYLAGVTLAFVVALPALTSVFSGVLRGDQGLQTALDPVPEALSRVIALEQWQAWIAIAVAAVVATGLVIVRRGTLGLRMRAVRDDEVAARLSGVRARRVKVAAFTISAAAAGAGGALLCVVTQSVSPGAYTLAFSLLLLVAAVIGGLGSIGGAALGSVLIVLLPWALNALTQSLPLSAEFAQRLGGNLTVLVFGLLLIVVTLAWPGGLVALGRRMPRRRATRAVGSPVPSSSSAPSATDPDPSSPAVSGTIPIER